jgi:hypothetical protein
LNGWRMFTKAERSFIFNDILCNPVYVNPKEITIEQFMTFKKFFEFINDELESIMV